jgi:signal transduction histidine kinase
VRNVLHQGDRRAAEAPLLALRGGIRETIDEVRRIIEDLRPPALDDLGLVEALRASLPQQPPVCLTAGSLPPLPAAVELAAYRIVQESLANAMRHAHPTRTEVAVRVEGGALLVVVRDDGTGGATPRPGGVGLTSMRERAEEVGGRLVLESSAGSGTTVRATLPLDSPT